eukprot:scaffold33143_cov129-Isochrysis_galbana.AAC.3
MDGSGNSRGRLQDHCDPFVWWAPAPKTSAWARGRGRNATWVSVMRCAWRCCSNRLVIHLQTIAVGHETTESTSA